MGFLLAGLHISLLPAARVIVTEVSQLASDNRRGESVGFARRTSRVTPLGLRLHFVLSKGTGDVTALADRTRHHQPSRAQPYLGLPQRHIRLLADAAPQRLPDLVARLMKRRKAALSRRRAAHRAWQTASTLQARGADRSHTRDRSRDHGLEL